METTVTNQETNKHIRELERMKTDFVSIASHQLRTPLTAINWYVEMLLSGDAGQLTQDQRSYLQEIEISTKRMVTLVNDLLNVSRIETGRLKIEPVSIDIVAFAKDVIHELMPWAQAKSCSIKLNVSQESLPYIPIDASLMRQVIDNLLTNAIRYSSPLKECDIALTLTLQNEGIAPEANDPFVPSSSLIIAVSDKGIGIPQESQPRIFEKFFRADNAATTEVRGSGLGLYLAKMIVEASGGKIWFESQEGEGATFYVAIPMQGMVKKAGERGLIV